ncbi:MAG: Sua5/YciO/YrdC/YwlC family protein [Alphaproteobacteria bacterium]|jgi:tRNA A37 threonylcarbamoyladenosine synthetase subunit TsaC/SUA5/YrdC|nr:Sua5/YciO/YrdC/YwlC family protein [Alphaproteobacteria bacterium]MDP6515455.1 Sua5/YciO/YrdC/YwlC family protein [Alphaproteobacteria bacterium]
MFDDRPIVEDARGIFDTVRAGGVAIFPVSVGYAIVGHGDEAIRRIYAAKERSFEKPCGNFCDWTLFTEAIVTSDRARAVVRAVIMDHDLPFSIVAPYRADHPVIASLGPFARRNASKAGTMDMLLNAGPLHDEIARLARENAVAVVGSSANLSLTGSKFRLEDIEAQVLDAADLAIDYGLCPYHNGQGLGSTIIDLDGFETIRLGCVYDRICAILDEEFDIDLKAITAAKGSD